MTKHRFRDFARYSLACFGVALLAAATFPAEAEAAAARFVASNGSDANPCTRTAPCRKLRRALITVPAGGELQILDSGLYDSALAINKSVTISANGVTATVGNITINGPGLVVGLDGLLLSGVGAGGTGILITNAYSVHIKNCIIERFLGDGIRVTNWNAELFITNSVSRSNGVHGLSFFSNPGTGGRLTASNSTFENNGNDGIEAVGILATIADSETSGNGDHGILVQNSWVIATRTTAQNNVHSGYDANNNGRVVLEGSAASGNAVGLHVSGKYGNAWIANSVFLGNTTDIHQEGSLSVIWTRNNNTANTVTGSLLNFPSR